MAETVNDSIKGLELALRPQIYQLQNDKKQSLRILQSREKLCYMELPLQQKR